MVGNLAKPAGTSGRMPTTPSRGRATPSFRRLADQLRERIFEGEFPEGRPLPTENSLALSHGLSRDTVRKAYGELVNEGLIFRVPGRGTFVSPSAVRYKRPFSSIHDLISQESDTMMEVVSPLARLKHPDAARELGLTDSTVWHLSFRRIHREKYFAYTDIYLPPEVGTQLRREEFLTHVGARNRTTIIHLIEQSGRQLVGAEQRISAILADGPIAGLLSVAAGDPLLQIQRSYLAVGNQPVEFAVSLYVPGRFTHTLRLGRGSIEGDASGHRYPTRGGSKRAAPR